MNNGGKMIFLMDAGFRAARILMKSATLAITIAMIVLATTNTSFTSLPAHFLDPDLLRLSR